jgi:hypothetical protein
VSKLGRTLTTGIKVNILFGIQVTIVDWKTSFNAILIEAGKVDIVRSVSWFTLSTEHSIFLSCTEIVIEVAVLIRCIKYSISTVGRQGSNVINGYSQFKLSNNTAYCEWIHAKLTNFSKVSISLLIS